MPRSQAPQKAAPGPRPENNKNKETKQNPEFIYSPGDFGVPRLSHKPTENHSGLVTGPCREPVEQHGPDHPPDSGRQASSERGATPAGRAYTGTSETPDVAKTKQGTSQNEAEASRRQFGFSMYIYLHLFTSIIIDLL